MTATTVRRASRGRSNRSAGRTGSGWLWVLVIATVLAAGVLLAGLLLARGEDGPDDAAGGLAGEAVDQFMHVHGLAIAPWSPDDVWLSTHQGLIRIDQSGRWRYASEEPHDFMGFGVHPQQEDVLYTSGHPAVQSDLENPVGFMVSTDAGRSWEKRSLHGQVDFHALAVHQADGDVIYGWDATGGRLLRSDDGGQDWQPRPVPDAEGVLALAVHPTDPDTVLAGTPAGLFTGSDGGDTWEPRLSDVPVTAVAHTGDDDTARIVAYAAEPGGDGLVESTDAGESWQPLDLELGEDVATHIAIHPTDGEVLYVGSMQENLYRTVDGGQSWEQLATNGTRTEEDR